MLLFQLNSTAKLLPPASFYNLKIFVRKTLFLFWKSLKFISFENCYNFSRFYGKFAAFANLKDFSFSRKTKVFFNTSKSQKLNVLRNLTNSFALYSKFVTIRDFSKFQGLFRKTHFFCKNYSFWTFWEISLFRSHSTLNWLTVSVAFDIGLAKFNCFQKIRFLFRKKPSNFSEPNFSSNPTNSVDFAASLLPLAI